tara:strand:- start:950 stop:1357 length:408 start_codon:yes stop_codon:yes gene_type:complete
MIRYLSTLKINKVIPLNVTKNAWDKMRNIIHNENAYCFYLSAKSGGCNGFSYDLKLFNQNEYDKTIFLQKNVNVIKNENIKLYIDPLSEMLLIGTTIDFINEDYKRGVFENKFTFTPDKKIASSCGCGVSFNPYN